MLKTKKKTKSAKKAKSIKGLKGQVWVIFSKYIRMRDCLRTTGTLKHGKCISCGDLRPINQCDAGHLISRWYGSTLFDERNVHLQCKRCNNMGETLKYRRAIIKLYGEGIDIELEDKATEIKHFTIPELEGMKKYYAEKVKELEKGEYVSPCGESLCFSENVVSNKLC